AVPRASINPERDGCAAHRHPVLWCDVRPSFLACEPWSASLLDPVGGSCGMRLCRFVLDDLVLAGFYSEDHVIPIHQATEAYCEDVGVEMVLPNTGELLELLPPDGAAFTKLCDLSEWVEALDVNEREELSIPIDEIRLLVPIGNPRKLLLLAGNYAAHII